jgi:triacylglycerol lipase
MEDGRIKVVGGDEPRGQSTPAQMEARLAEVVSEARALSEKLTPITEAMVAAAPTWRAAYSDRTSALMASLCAIAYDNFEDQTGAGRDLMAHRLRKGGFELINTYSTLLSTQASLAASDQMIVLAFRGTQDGADWMTNLGAKLTALNPTAARSVQIHRGFLEAFQDVERKIRPDLDRLPADKGLYITGHSLGGALAQIASSAFERDTLAACYTFGSPRVGQKRFDAEVKCPHYRLVNARDVVPSVPPPWLGFAHGGDVRVLSRKGGLKRYERTPALLIFRFALFGLWWALTRKFPLIDDHMIGRYREKLIKAANFRAPGWKAGGLPPEPPTTPQAPEPETPLVVPAAAAPKAAAKSRKRKAPAKRSEARKD